MQLAIDTSTDNASIAMTDGSAVIFELTWKCGQNHTVELLPRLSFLLERHGIDMKAIDAVFVALGPGSFNGIRVGLSTAKGFAVSLSVPVIGISTLSVQAYPHSLAGLPVCAVFNAGRGEISTATYQMRDSKWVQLAPERVTMLDALIQETSTKTVFCGDYVPAIEGQLKSALGEKAVIPEPSANQRRAVYLAELGNMELKAGRLQNPATLQPIYLRRPAITAPRKRLSPDTIGAKNLKAVIFDMDGVIVDSAEAHFKAWHDSLKKCGIEFTRDDFKRIFGKRDDVVIKEFLGDLPEKEVWDFSDRKEAYFREVIRASIKALPGAVELIKSLKASGFRVGLGSSAHSENVRLILQTLKIEEYFDAVAAGREAKESKPSPQLFLLVARKLGVPPERCIVIEDAVAGVSAAKQGGMKAVAVTNTHPKEELSEADLIVSSLKEVSVARLRELLDGGKNG